MEKLISIIVPVYNVESYLSRCIDSILNQTYEELEVILVDDGSTDNSGNICDEYLAKDSRIKVVHQENMGLSMARNTGLNIAKGNLIGFVDSDDYIHPKMYEVLYDALINNNANISICNYKKILETDFNYKKIDKYEFCEYNQDEALNRICFGDTIMIYSWNKLYRKEIFTDVRYPKGKVCEDAHIIIDILLLCSKVVYVDEELYYYSNERDNSIMRNKYNLKMYFDNMEAVEKFLVFFEKNKRESLYSGYCWAFFRYIERINYHYKQIKKNFPERRDLLYKLAREYIKLYTWKNRKLLIKKNIRHKFDRVWLKFKIERLLYLDKDIKKVQKEKMRKNLIKRIESDKGKRIFLIGTPEYNNLGDHAIAIASKKFLNDNCSDYSVYEITSSDFLFGKSEFKRVITEDDVILITGGGFLGSLWVTPFGEEMVREILKCFAKNKIVILPQTIYFDDNDYGREQLKISKEIYEAHKNLTICLREKKSFEFMKSTMPKVDIKMIPDMVFYLREKEVEKNRKGAIACFRNDKEKVFDDEEKFLKRIKEKYRNITKLDTVLAKQIPIKFREKFVNTLLKKFRKSKIVYTDRLHGMLFAYITNTPVFAFDNLSGKIKSTYDTWINNRTDGTEKIIIDKKDYDKKIIFEKYWKELSELINS